MKKKRQGKKNLKKQGRYVPKLGKNDPGFQEELEKAREQEGEAFEKEDSENENENVKDENAFSSDEEEEEEIV